MRGRPGPAARRLRLRVGEADRGRRLDDAVAAMLRDALGRDVPRSAVRRLVMSGSVRRNGRPLRRPAFELAPGDLIECALLEERLTPAADRLPPLGVAILFEDQALVVVDKPAGVPTHATADPRRPHLVGLVLEYLARRDRTSPYLGVHQRLDADTSGVVLFAKDPAANASLATQFAKRGIEKTYHALAARPPTLPAQSFRIASRLARADGGPRTASVTTGGQAAETDIRVLEALASALLVEARPRTGRRHQIRAQLSEAGMPILGDSLYGSAETAQAAPRTMLHASRLSLNHPTTGEPLTIESPHPQDFARLLEALRRAPASAAPRRTVALTPASRTRRPPRGNQR
jgi:23S rRNA pseudouridine1911/1915/1917 synthase